MDRTPGARTTGAAGPERLVRHLMTREVVTVVEDATLADVADMLRGFDLSALPVIDMDERLVGVISETDLCGCGRPACRGVAGIACPWGRS